MIVQPQRDERNIRSIKIETIVWAMVAALRQKLGRSYVGPKPRFGFPSSIHFRQRNRALGATK
jgi:hypothetical protein